MIEIKKYEALSLNELYDILKLRTNVFVVEQNCPYPELDDVDKKSLHLILTEEEKITGTLRIIEQQNLIKIGRVAVAEELRGKGLGVKIMNAAIDFIKINFTQKTIKISAQQYLDDFYSNLGFESTGNKYLEDGIPHQEMVLKF